MVLYFISKWVAAIAVTTPERLSRLLLRRTVLLPFAPESDSAPVEENSEFDTVMLLAPESDSAPVEENSEFDTVMLLAPESDSAPVEENSEFDTVMLLAPSPAQEKTFRVFWPSPISWQLSKTTWRLLIRSVSKRTPLADSLKARFRKTTTPP